MILKGNHRSKKHRCLHFDGRQHRRSAENDAARQVLPRLERYRGVERLKPNAAHEHALCPLLEPGQRKRAPCIREHLPLKLRQGYLYAGNRLKRRVDDRSTEDSAGDPDERHFDARELRKRWYPRLSTSWAFHTVRRRSHRDARVHWNAAESERAVGRRGC